VTRPERSKQERRVSQAREANAEFDRILAEELAALKARRAACPNCGPEEPDASGA
jgi:DNA repair exonuclease SbcCD ATPase subunit